ncbi:hypothetical protein EDB92DRAFT_1139722 [Lactarius akahatsu]|uniref:Uncharacterized protein n=1 Tax=Lactarius akahatsu TaxID=416441 RepID=A0AAD4QBN1_9AGAM|nr:hypothetical protein EDB92DRAFT_1139722 [Lactarius akahatsu]
MPAEISPGKGTAWVASLLSMLRAARFPILTKRMNKMAHEARAEICLAWDMGVSVMYTCHEPVPFFLPQLRVLDDVIDSISIFPFLSVCPIASRTGIITERWKLVVMSRSWLLKSVLLNEWTTMEVPAHERTALTSKKTWQTSRDFAVGPQTLLKYDA